jgi:Cu2+-containing amine oxidase
MAARRPQAGAGNQCHAVPRSGAGGKRAEFMFKHFWATRYAPGELYPAGWFPNQHAGGDGIGTWTKAGRNLENENVVVWYTLNYHHVCRPEDWPVQPVVYASFHWMPAGFFERNPALDVPPPANPGWARRSLYFATAQHKCAIEREHPRRA